MKTIPPSRKPRRPHGLSLIELTIAITVALGIASASMAMLSQQLNLSRMFRDQAFLLEDCPSINNLLSRTLGRIDSYRIYPDLEGAKAGGAAVLNDGTAVLLTFRDSMNRLEFSIIAAEPQPDGRVRLGFYNRVGGNWGNEPDWIISSEASAVEYFVENGVLRVRLTGPNGDQITYSGHTQS